MTCRRRVDFSELALRAKTYSPAKGDLIYRYEKSSDGQVTQFVCQDSELKHRDEKCLYRPLKLPYEEMRLALIQKIKFEVKEVTLLDRRRGCEGVVMIVVFFIHILSCQSDRFVSCGLDRFVSLLRYWL